MLCPNTACWALNDIKINSFVAKFPFIVESRLLFDSIRRKSIHFAGVFGVVQIILQTKRNRKWRRIRTALDERLWGSCGLIRNLAVHPLPHNPPHLELHCLFCRDLDFLQSFRIMCSSCCSDWIPFRFLLQNGHYMQILQHNISSVLVNGKNGDFARNIHIIRLDSEMPLT